MGDFNMSHHRLKKIYQKNFPTWFVVDYYGYFHTFSRGTKSSSIDHVVFNSVLAEFNNLLSVICSLESLITSQLLYLVKKYLSNVFVLSLKTSRWSNKHICNTKSREILTHNYYDISAE